MSKAILKTIAGALVADSKGILAADESPPIIQRYFESVALIDAPETRRDYRRLLVTTPGLQHFISGIILCPETLDQYTGEGIPLVEVIETSGMIPGVNVDRGTEKLPLSPKERLSHGLYGLRERLRAYRDKGARFAKWRAVFSVDPGTPSDYCIAANVHQLACFAAFCQEGGLVPIVESELLMDGSHSLERCEHDSGRILERLFAVLLDYGVALEGLLLKTNMVVPGRDCRLPCTAGDVALATSRCLSRHVPPPVPGVLFLSGGLAPETATEYLAAIVAERLGPWILSFSFGHALQEPALRTWRGRSTQITAAQQALYRHAEYNAAAIRGYYNPQLERIA